MEEKPAGSICSSRNSKRRLSVHVGSIIIALLFLTCTLSVVGTYTVAAETEGYYEYTLADGAATITGYTGSDAEITIPSTLGGFPVVAIGENAFSNCGSLVSIVIPDSVYFIGYLAFYHCSALASVTIGSGIGMETSFEESFYWCDALTAINVSPDNPNWKSDDGVLYDKTMTWLIIYPAGRTEPSFNIPSSVTHIAFRSFAECSGLVSIVIPDSVIFIYGCAFIYCSALASVTIGNGVTLIGDLAFASCTALTSVTIPDSVTTIDFCAFSGCALTSVTIPDSVISIGYLAFSQCYDLTAIDVSAGNPAYVSVDGVLYDKTMTTLIQYPIKKTGPFNIPSSVATIEEEAFAYADWLTSIVIPDSVTTIGWEAFAYCDALEYVVIGSGVTSIEGWAFGSCYDLTEICFEGNAPSCGASWIANPNADLIIYYYYGATGFTNPWDDVPTVCWASPSDFYCFPFNGGTEIEIGGYCGAGGSVLVPGIIEGKRVTSFHQYTFHDCDVLTSVTIPNHVTTIGAMAFADCNALTSVTIPDSVTTIGQHAFLRSALTSVTIPDSVTTIGDFAFIGCLDLTAIDVSPGNPNYKSVDGVLYDKTMTTLIQCPAGKTGPFNIPNGVTTIGTGAFSWGHLLSVTIPNSVTTIGQQAFEDSTSLASVDIGSGVTKIGVLAFGDCSALTSITFHGLKAPTTVAWSWIDNTPPEILGHAGPASDFPAPGEYFHGLLMGGYVGGPQTALVSFSQNGVGASALDTVLAVDGLSYLSSQLPVSFTWSIGTHHEFVWSSVVNDGPGTRHQWQSSSGLSSAQSGTIVALADGSIVASYSSEYLITVTSAHGSPSPAPSSWVNAGDDFTASVTSPAETVPEDHQWACTGYVLDGGLLIEGTSCTIMGVDAAHTIEFQWQQQFWVAFSQIGVGSDFTGTVMTVDSQGYGNSGHAGWYGLGATITFSYGSPLVVIANGKQHVLTGLDTPSPLTVSVAQTVTGTYDTQYYLTVVSAYDTPGGEGWYMAETTATATLEQANVEISGTQHVFIGWTINGVPVGTSLSQTVWMDAPKIAVANWVALIVIGGGPGNPPKSPDTRAGSYEYPVSVDGTWRARVVNDGIPYIDLEVIDVTAGNVQVMLQHVKFARVGAFPTGEIYSDSVHMTAGHVYEIVVTPYGGRGSLQVFDEFTPDVGSSGQSIGASSLGLLGIQLLSAICLCYYVALEIGRLAKRELPVPKTEKRRTERMLSIPCEVLGLK